MTFAEKLRKSIFAPDKKVKVLLSYRRQVRNSMR